ncbi:MAG TPA: hypothetical protein VKE24_14510 [Candidatus Acidoferrales bacterium]|nr:hypothetical protein [Candidatus Acidoferrales bacterium]
MANKTTRVLLKLTSDARLLAGVGGAIGFFAALAGLDSQASANLIAAAEEACRDCFPQLSPDDPLLDVRIENLTDRIQVTLEHRSRPTPGAATASGHGTAARRVDRVEYKAEGGVSRTTIIQYLRRPPDQR